MKKIKNLIVFDLDPTLAKGDMVMDTQIAGLLNQLLELTKVAVISGSDWSCFEKKLLPALPEKQYLKNLIFLPVSGTRYYQYRSGWKEMHTEILTVAEKDKIKTQLQKVLDTSGKDAGKVLGEQFEFKGSDIIFSCLGQQATAKAKQAYDPDHAKRKEIKMVLDEVLFNYSVQIEGPDLIVISKTGIDKAHGIYKLHQILDIKTKKILFIGSALFEGGNDYAAIATGVECIQVKNPDETKIVIETIIACLHMVYKKKHESV
ncbi:HAD-IIB family hydrolase [Mucilaginibacter flavidus]|uniref:HAD-IIB family hydrolase n=1 Tax=Mucilaginibacter flavidus TaxID=2949309 RepID=UPI00209243E0|nr:HAD-IIB family hydrolase [Mucilaginibacter flavidus]MCO5948623.1 HAD-IIB family hydrolase [Mucilaginibacter flavidus]